jgi:outer membrane protein TolC
MSLEQCIEYALANSPDVKVASLKVADAEWQIQENKSFGYPQLQAGLGYQHFLKVPALPASALGFGTSDERIAFQLRNNANGSLGWNQLLFSNDYLLGLRAARLLRELAEEELEATRRAVRNTVTDAYLPTLIIAESVGILDKNIGTIQTLLNETEATRQAGFAEQLDVDRLRLTRSTLNSQRANIIRQRETVVNALKFTMGYPVVEPLEVSDDIETLLATYGVIDTAAVLNLSDRPEYRQILKARALQNLDVERYARPWMPTVGGFLSGQGSFQGNSELFWIPSAVAGVSASINLWDGGISRARRERAKLAVANIEQQEAKLVNALHLEVVNAQKTYVSAMEDYRNRRDNLALAERIYETTQVKFRAGVGSSFELVTTEQQLFDAQRALIDAQFQLLSALSDYRQALAIN